MKVVSTSKNPIQPIEKSRNQKSKPVEQKLYAKLTIYNASTMTAKEKKCLIKWLKDREDYIEVNSTNFAKIVNMRLNRY